MINVSMEAHRDLTGPEVLEKLNALMSADMDLGLQIGAFAQVGSSLVPGAAASDFDIVVCVDSPGLVDRVHAYLGGKWVSPDVQYMGEDGLLITSRQGDVNLLFTTNPTFADRFVTAAMLSAHLRVTDKDSRILLHRVVRDGMGFAQAYLSVYPQPSELPSV